jgi:hypothetical protein
MVDGNQGIASAARAMYSWKKVVCRGGAAVPMT